MGSRSWDEREGEEDSEIALEDLQRSCGGLLDLHPIQSPHNPMDLPNPKPNCGNLTRRDNSVWSPSAPNLKPIKNLNLNLKYA